METASAAGHCRLLCSIHNISHEDDVAEQWISTVLEPDFHVDHCQRIEGKSGPSLRCSDTRFLLRTKSDNTRAAIEHKNKKITIIFSVVLY